LGAQESSGSALGSVLICQIRTPPGVEDSEGTGWSSPQAGSGRFDSDWHRTTDNPEVDCPRRTITRRPRFYRHRAISAARGRPRTPSCSHPAHPRCPLPSTGELSLSLPRGSPVADRSAWACLANRKLLPAPALRYASLPSARELSLIPTPRSTVAGRSGRLFLAHASFFSSHLGRDPWLARSVMPPF